MSVNITGILGASLQWTATETETQTTSLNNTIVDSGATSYTYNFTSGTGAGAVNQLWHDIRILPSGGEEEFDLTALTQTVLNGSFSIAFSKVKGFIVKNDSAQDITISMTGANSWGEPLAYPTGEIVVPHSGSFLITNVDEGWDVDSSNKTIQIHDVTGSGSQYHISAIGLA
jgi:hypothetical protein